MDALVRPLPTRKDSDEGVQVTFSAGCYADPLRCLITDSASDRDDQRRSVRLSRSGVQRRRLCREAAAVEPAFPPARGAKSRIIGRDCVLLAASRHQLESSVGQDFRHSPELVHLVRIPVAMFGRVDLLGAWSRIGACLADSKDDRVTRLKLGAHVCQPSRQNP